MVTKRWGTYAVGLLAGAAFCCATVDAEAATSVSLHMSTGCNGKAGMPQVSKYIFVHWTNDGKDPEHYFSNGDGSYGSGYLYNLIRGMEGTTAMGTMSTYFSFSPISFFGQSYCIAPSFFSNTAPSSNVVGYVAPGPSLPNAPPVPTSDTDDSKIQALVNYVAATVGGNDPNNVYVILGPPGYNANDGGGCGYHSNAGDNKYMFLGYQDTGFAPCNGGTASTTSGATRRGSTSASTTTPLNSRWSRSSDGGETWVAAPIPKGPSCCQRWPESAQEVTTMHGDLDGYTVLRNRLSPCSSKNSSMSCLPETCRTTYPFLPTAPFGLRSAHSTFALASPSGLKSGTEHGGPRAPIRRQRKGVRRGADRSS